MSKTASQVDVAALLADKCDGLGCACCNQMDQVREVIHFAATVLGQPLDPWQQWLVAS
jgi:hypothetical protein